MAYANDDSVPLFPVHASAAVAARSNIAAKTAKVTGH